MSYFFLPENIILCVHTTYFLWINKKIFEYLLVEQKELFILRVMDHGHFSLFKAYTEGINPCHAE